MANLVEVFGVLEWAKIFQHNREMRDAYGELHKSKPVDMVPDSEAGQYEINILLPRSEIAKLKAAGAKQEPKKDPATGFPLEISHESFSEPLYKLKFRRYHCVPKAPAAGGAPDVVFADGRALDPKVDGEVGNGSIGSLIIRVDTFQIQGKPASRAVLQKVIVHQLVPFFREGATSEEEVISGSSDEIEKLKQRLAASPVLPPVTKEAVEDGDEIVGGEPSPVAPKPAVDVSDDSVLF